MNCSASPKLTVLILCDLNLGAPGCVPHFLPRALGSDNPSGVGALRPQGADVTWTSAGLEGPLIVVTFKAGPRGQA